MYLVYRTPSDQPIHFRDDADSFVDTVRALNRKDGKNVISQNNDIDPNSPIKFTFVTGISMSNKFDDNVQLLINEFAKQHKMIVIQKRGGYFSNDWFNKDTTTEFVLVPEEMRGYIQGKNFGL